MVKELRERTQAGMTDCKNALVEALGDMEKAVEVILKKGIVKAAARAGRVATEGEARAIETQLHVISTHLVGGQHEIRVHSDISPGDGFHSVESDLEDVYFLNLSQQSKRQLPN